MEAIVVSNKIKDDVEIKISGYKHSLVMVLCAALILNIEVVIDNVPKIKETEIFLEVLKMLGKKYKYSNGKIYLYNSSIWNKKIPERITKQVHGTIYLWPVLLFLNKSVKLFETGGCRIGDLNTFSGRPIEHMYSIMEKFGAYIADNTVYLDKNNELKTIDIREYSSDSDVLSGPLVSGATKTAILCALGSKERIVIKNPYMKADVLEMIEFLKECGVKVEFINDNLIMIPQKLKKRVQYKLTSDVSEIITFISFSQYHKVKINLTNISNIQIVKKALKQEIIYLNRMGMKIKWEKNVIKIFPTNNTKSLGTIHVNGETIYSDSQPFFVLSLIDSADKTIIVDDVWNNRFEYAKELEKVGEPIKIINNKTIELFSSEKKIKNTNSELIAKDLRGAACLLIYASKHIGQKVIGVEHIERGYDDFWLKLKQLGVEYNVN